jgi:hypothetical protein
MVLRAPEIDTSLDCPKAVRHGKGVVPTLQHEIIASVFLQILKREPENALFFDTVALNHFVLINWKAVSQLRAARVTQSIRFPDSMIISLQNLQWTRIDHQGMILEFDPKLVIRVTNYRGRSCLF